MTTLSFPEGFAIQLRTDSWIPVIGASAPVSQQLNEYSDNREMYPQCTQSWGDTARGEYWMQSANWYDLAPNITGPDRKQGALLGLYVDAWVFDPNRDVDSWLLSPHPFVRGQAVEPESMQIENFGAEDRPSREACARVQLWIGPPQLPVFNRPDANKIQIQGDWILGGLPPGSDKFLFMNATAVFQETLADPDVPPSVSTSVPPTQSLSDSQTSSQSTTTSTASPSVTPLITPPPSLPTSRSNPSIIIAVVVASLGFIGILLLVGWLIRRRRARRGQSGDSEADIIRTSYLRAFTLTTNNPSNLGGRADQKAGLLEEKRLTPYRFSPTHDAMSTPPAKQLSRSPKAVISPSGVILSTSSSGPSASLQSTSVMRPGTAVVRGATIPVAVSPRRDHEDDENMLRELRGAMRGAGFTVNMLFARLGARAESVTGTDVGLPPYDAPPDVSGWRRRDELRQEGDLAARRGLGRR